MRPKVLIIEDEPAIAQAEKLILEEFYEVHHAKDGETGLQMVEQIRPDLVVLDLMLPHRGGYDVSFTIRQNPKFSKTKIVMVTAKNLSSDQEKGMLVGADHYITKPFEPEQLLDAVQRVLGNAPY
ncbi:MAG TPA: response regulator [Candidatus Nanoarchaeia archaeon]|nr:response regulator [Candidatus Nanoarchaeia archaeon]